MAAFGWSRRFSNRLENSSRGWLDLGHRSRWLVFRRITSVGCTGCFCKICVLGMKLGLASKGHFKGFFFGQKVLQTCLHFGI